MLVERRQRKKNDMPIFKATGELSDRHVCGGPAQPVEANRVEGWPWHAMALECLWSYMITGAWIHWVPE